MEVYIRLAREQRGDLARRHDIRAIEVACIQRNKNSTRDTGWTRAVNMRQSRRDTGRANAQSDRRRRRVDEGGDIAKRS